MCLTALIQSSVSPTLELSRTVSFSFKRTSEKVKKLTDDGARNHEDLSCRTRLVVRLKLKRESFSRDSWPFRLLDILNLSHENSNVWNSEN